MERDTRLSTLTARIDHPLFQLDPLVLQNVNLQIALIVPIPFTFSEEGDFPNRLDSRGSYGLVKMVSPI